MRKIYLFLFVMLIAISCKEQKKPVADNTKTYKDTNQKPFIPLRPDLLNQQTPTATTNPMANSIDPANPKSVDEIILLHYRAKGGIERIKATKTMKVTGKMTSMGQEVPFTMFFKRPYSTKIVKKIQGKEMIQAFDGKEGWIRLGDSTLTLPPEAAEEFKRESDILEGPFYDYQSKGMTITMAGKEKIEGRDNFKLKVSTADKALQEWVFVDCTSFLITKIRSKIKAKDKSQTIDMFVLNYKDVDGMIMSHLNLTKVDGKIIASMAYDKIELNINLDDTIFKKSSK